MNCKPDQLCRVLSGHNANAIVRTKYQCSCAVNATAVRRGMGPLWTCEALQHMDLYEYGKFEGDVERIPPGTEVCIADANLKPLGDEGPEDLTVSEELKQFMDRETRKVIPLIWNPEGEKV